MSTKDSSQKDEEIHKEALMNIHSVLTFEEILVLKLTISLALSTYLPTYFSYQELMCFDNEDKHQ